jgi:vacuolar-type H+-ATPase subunit B/Vma2
MPTRDEMDRELYAPTPPEPGDVLVQLGMIDPQTGRAYAGGTDYEWDDNPQPLVQQETASAWDSPENPYKREVEQLRAQTPQVDKIDQARGWLAQQNGAIEQQAGAFRSNLLSQRDAQGRMMVAPELADVITNLGKEAAFARAREQAFQYATQDVATESAARRIAKDHSVGNVRVNPRDLLAEQTAEGMAARARTLVTMQSQDRDTRFAARRDAGVDRREGGAGLGNSSTRAMDGLSSAQMIRLGLLRGD